MDQSISKKIHQLLLCKSYVAIIPHRSPDGDAIGSALALKQFINQFHQNVDIFCIDPAPLNTHFLPGAKNIKHKLDLNTQKILCFVDCGSSEMSQYHKQFPDIFNRKDIITINIDHHQSNNNFAQLNYVDPLSASTTQIIFNLFQDWKATITPSMANALLTGLHFDTGSFKHQNTDFTVLKTASQLTALGGNNQQITKNLFNTNSVSQLKLWGKVLNRTNLTSKKIITSTITQKDFTECQASSKDLEGIIDYLNAIPNKKFSILISEDNNNGIKASLRTLNPKYNLNKIANLFGGGGHPMASGFRLEAKLTQKDYWQIT